MPPRRITVKYAAVPFTVQNAVFAEDPWLFGLDGEFNPQDEVIAPPPDGVRSEHRSRATFSVAKRATARPQAIRTARGRWLTLARY
jgi:hypothetical protein